MNLNFLTQTRIYIVEIMRNRSKLIFFLNDYLIVWNAICWLIHIFPTDLKCLLKKLNNPVYLGFPYIFSSVPLTYQFMSFISYHFALYSLNIYTWLQLTIFRVWWFKTFVIPTYIFNTDSWLGGIFQQFFWFVYSFFVFVQFISKWRLSQVSVIQEHWSTKSYIFIKKVMTL